MEINMIFAVAIHKDHKSDYGVSVPDLQGCFSAGSTMDEALQNTREAIELHMEAMLDEGLPIPTCVGIIKNSPSTPS